MLCVKKERYLRKRTIRICRRKGKIARVWIFMTVSSAVFRNYFLLCSLSSISFYTLIDFICNILVNKS